jgi:hypothetical protein
MLLSALENSSNEASSSLVEPTEDMAKYDSLKITLNEDTIIEKDLLEVFKATCEISNGGTKEVRMSTASPVLVGDTLKIGEGIATKDENGNIVSFEFNEGAA